MFLKNRNNFSKIKKSKVTDHAALTDEPISILGVERYLSFFQILIQHSASSEDPDQTRHHAVSDLVCTVCLCPISRMLHVGFYGLKYCVSLVLISHPS